MMFYHFSNCIRTIVRQHIYHQQPILFWVMWLGHDLEFDNYLLLVQIGKAN